jgi:hypothetical protein
MAQAQMLVQVLGFVKVLALVRVLVLVQAAALLTMVLVQVKQTRDQPLVLALVRVLVQAAALLTMVLVQAALQAEKIKGQQQSQEQMLTMMLLTQGLTT